MKKFKSGFVTIIGRPNVGKSTLMNRLIGEKIAIISNKPQTTRNQIRTVLTRDDYQMVFIDTPGIHKPKHKLGEYMVRSSQIAMNEVDVVLMLVEPDEVIGTGDKYIIDSFSTNANVFLVINKIDKVKKDKLLNIINGYKGLYNFKEIIPISALNGENTEELLDTIANYFEEGPKFFDETVITDQPERQIVAELIREKALKNLDQEVPHGIAVEIMSMKSRKNKELVDIEATIYCERDTHKGIIIGKKGSMLKKIGTTARIDIERLLGSKINLNLWVKVKKDWRDNDFLLRNFGYDKKQI